MLSGSRRSAADPFFLKGVDPWAPVTPVIWRIMEEPHDTLAFAFSARVFRLCRCLKITSIKMPGAHFIVMKLTG